MQYPPRAQSYDEGITVAIFFAKRLEWKCEQGIVNGGIVSALLDCHSNVRTTGMIPVRSLEAEVLARPLLVALVLLI
jgi:hypothetical protein